ncbi:flagellar motor switch phosphatase FliY [Lentibacillus cibarius]|uniref:Flagellar motor switch phosphatase FliY n=1 Tax=Lentibacillus cibarius TaxID=2583219 RepID=A0A5S3QPK7_9BACI|nr:flagellar motor switch phosphatase FliY [Lentibacillus cibarius]TMN23587.1 flagellar motor switch phosphatase FliY [Lentibacillus cibarius]
MDEGKLSQDEIDALLQVGEEEKEPEEQTINSEEILSEVEKDTLGEIGNISFGSSATTLSTLLNQKVAITTPEVSLITSDELDNAFEGEHVTIYVHYTEGFDGQNVLVMKVEDTAIIADIMMGGDGTSPDQELGELHLSAVQEAMNQMMGTAATSMATIFGKRVDISPPSIHLESPAMVRNEKEISEAEYVVKVSFNLKVGSLIDSNIMQIIPFPFARQLVNQLMQASSGSSDVKEEPVTKVDIEKPAETASESRKAPGEENREVHTTQYIGDNVNQSASSIQQATFSNLEQVDLDPYEKRNLDMLLDIPLNVSVELGRTKRTIKDILELSTGSIIELDKLAGEPVDILVNKKLIAKGEVVVIDENFGVRVTDIISQSDRLMKLK